MGENRDSLQKSFQCFNILSFKVGTVILKKFILYISVCVFMCVCVCSCAYVKKIKINKYCLQKELI